MNTDERRFFESPERDTPLKVTGYGVLGSRASDRLGRDGLIRSTRAMTGPAVRRGSVVTFIALDGRGGHGYSL